MYFVFNFYYYLRQFTDFKSLGRGCLCFRFEIDGLFNHFRKREFKGLSVDYYTFDTDMESIST